MTKPLVRRNSSRRWKVSTTLLLSYMVVAMSAFYLGLLVGHTSTNTQALNGSRRTTSETEPSQTDSQDNNQNTLFPSTLNDLFVGGATVSRESFIKNFDLGVPWDEVQRGFKDVLMLYGPNGAPTTNDSLGNNNSSTTTTTTSTTHYNNALDATAQCDAMKVILTGVKKTPCLALVGQWESYHVHKFLRIKEDHDKNKRTPIHSHKYPLRVVSRDHDEKGRLPGYPTTKQTKGYWSILVDYLQKLPHTLDRLTPLAKKVAGDGNTIVVLVCNFGQSELLVNFVCSSRARGLDLSRVLVFATDHEVQQLASGLGIAVFDVQDAFGDDMPTGAAKTYGDRTFRGMMMAKAYCVHLVNALGYDLLFQDVDVVWYKDPVEYFESEDSGNFDFYFQDDGAHSKRYAPYSPNSGLYFVRNNERTKYFFQMFIRMGDLIMASGSHQSVLNSLLVDQSSSRGLKVKVFQRDSELGRQFPGGYHYHMRKNFMKDIIKGKRKPSPYIFHMSWTKNKENKRKFFQQLGDWYVKDQCVGKTVSEIESSQLEPKACCSVKPIVECHYRDKPSKNPCKDNVAIDAGSKSFW